LKDVRPLFDVRVLYNIYLRYFYAVVALLLSEDAAAGNEQWENGALTGKRVLGSGSRVMIRG